MAGAFLTVDPPPEIHQRLLPPEAIWENQQLGWTNSWEATPEFSASWTEKLVFEERPPPFQVVKEQDKKDGAVGDFDSTDLKELVYPSDPRAARYVVQVDSSTDCEGWIYATKPSRLEALRLGGRATQRLNDKMRRRVWRHCGAGASPTKPEAAPVETTQNNQSAMQSLWKALVEVIGRRSLSEIPVDPTAVIRRSHYDLERYQQLCERLLPWDDVPMLMEMLVAALYSRAAYGYTGRRGLFDSVAQGAFVFSVSRAVFDYAEHVDDASNDLAFRDMLALLPEDLVKTQWKGSTLQPVYVLCRDHALQWIVVAVRGTLSQNDIWTDCAVSSVPFLEGAGLRARLTGLACRTGRAPKTGCKVRA
ncbi:unnamed protein product [Durusdinium trenchii]|uniref:Rab3 GTPase-activating protein catalytic subunit n=1 Tax=Durusdinium trenchii TaxID=1381693 RepID=A0ABP0S1Q4_9DINO